MKIQLALDRLTIPQAIEICHLVKGSVEWLEVGTSLIKEFGVSSIQEIKSAFLDKVIVADVKTMDNAKYEFEMCYKAGADVATVMGLAPNVTIDTCMGVATARGKQVMIDLLNTDKMRQEELMSRYPDAIFCDHVSKDEQEISGKKNGLSTKLFSTSIQLAVAGGITLQSLTELKTLNPDVVIIGSAITKAKDPRLVAKEFQNRVR